MEIIRELEADPRGVYTGAIGYLSPGRKARFNVAIRTVAIDRGHGRGGIRRGRRHRLGFRTRGRIRRVRNEGRRADGGTSVLRAAGNAALRRRAGYFLLERHLRRLAESAEYFAFAVDLAEVRRRLDDLACGFRGAAHRVRLCVSRQGDVAVEAAPLPVRPTSPPWRLRLAQRPIDRRNVFLYHKTTCRGVYEAAARRAMPATTSSSGTSRERRPKRPSPTWWSGSRGGW